MFKCSNLSFQRRVAPKRVRLAEMTTTEETVIRGQRRGMRTFQHQVLRRGYQRLFRAGVSAPEKEYDGFRPLVEPPYHRVGDLFPSLPLCELGSPARTVSTVLSNSTPLSAHGTRQGDLFSAPTSSCISLKMLTSDGGAGTPGLTENKARAPVLRRDRGPDRGLRLSPSRTACISAH